MTRGFAKSIFFVVLWCGFLFSFLEFGAGLILAGSSNALSITRRILEVVPDAGWRQRANLDTKFLGLSLKTNELGWRALPVDQLKEAEHIAVLGPSSAFGWGVEGEDTYPALLEGMIGRKVINAGQIGYSSYQGLRLLEKLPSLELKPKMIIFSYGVNDLDRHRFYFQSDRTDQEEFATLKPPLAMRAINTVLGSSLLSVLLDFSIFLRTLVAPVESPLVDKFPLPQLRVPVDAFGENLVLMIRYAKKLGAHVLLLTTTSNLESQSEALSPRKDGAEDQRAAKLHDAMTRGDRVAARNILDEIVSLNPSACDEFYYLSGLAKAAGETALAAEFYRKALANEPFRIKADIAVYNSKLREVAESESVSVGDIDEWIAQAALKENGDRSSLFVDPIHFSKKGNLAIASEIRKVIDARKWLE